MAPGEHEIEQGFGTGLRAQLESRRESEAPVVEPEAPDTPALPPAAEVDPDAAPAFGEVDTLRKELYEARARE
ncbi:MAG: hypothetical protein ABIR67_07215, partial [Gaiellaceae bacterium]